MRGPTYDESVVAACAITAVVYKIINPNLDAERDMYDSGDMSAYYAAKYAKWLLSFVGFYYASKLLFTYVRGAFKRLTTAS
jgi:hypothetical protein